MDKLRVPPELADVADQVGEFMEYWGFKNIYGRIWTHLFLSKDPLDAGTLIRRLEVSKALMSMSLAELLDYEVILVAGKSENGTTTYCANPNLTYVISTVLRKRERRMLSRISSATNRIPQIQDEDGAVELSGERIQTLLSMVSTAEQALDSFLSLDQVNFEEWKDFNLLPPVK